MSINLSKKKIEILNIPSKTVHRRSFFRIYASVKVVDEHFKKTVRNKRVESRDQLCSRKIRYASLNCEDFAHVQIACHALRMEIWRGRRRLINFDGEGLQHNLNVARSDDHVQEIQQPELRQPHDAKCCLAHPVGHQPQSRWTDACGQLCVPCAECRGTSCKQRCVVAWWCQKISSGMAGGKGNFVLSLSR